MNFLSEFPDATIPAGLMWSAPELKIWPESR
jgi:hypothetical protein